jgi:hypothetical protein
MPPRIENRGMEESTAGPSGPASDRPAMPVRLWLLVILLVALVIALLGGVRNFRADADIAAPDTVELPTPIEPEGEIDVPPSVFRWEPGGPDVTWAQVTIYRGSFERIWESAPLADTVWTTDPREAFRGIPAGEECFWKVREVVDGRPRAASRYVPFTFRKDARGYGPGEAPPEARYVD